MSTTFAAAAALPTAVIDTFGDAVVYTRVGGEVLSLTAVFDAAHHVDDLDADGRKITTVLPTLYARLADFGATPPARNDRFQIGTARYTVQRTAIDGCGGVSCYGVAT